jgi:hypothetical protein
MVGTGVVIVMSAMPGLDGDVPAEAALMVTTLPLGIADGAV